MRYWIASVLLFSAATYGFDYEPNRELRVKALRRIRAMERRIESMRKLNGEVLLYDESISNAYSDIVGSGPNAIDPLVRFIVRPQTTRESRHYALRYLMSIVAIYPKEKLHTDFPELYNRLLPKLVEVARSKRSDNSEKIQALFAIGALGKEAKSAAKQIRYLAEGDKTNLSDTAKRTLLKIGARYWFRKKKKKKKPKEAPVEVLTPDQKLKKSN